MFGNSIRMIFCYVAILDGKCILFLSSPFDLMVGSCCFSPWQSLGIWMGKVHAIIVCVETCQWHAFWKVYFNYHSHNLDLMYTISCHVPLPGASTNSEYCAHRFVCLYIPINAAYFSMNTILTMLFFSTTSS